MKMTLGIGFTTETLYEAESTRIKRIKPVLAFPFFVVEKKVGYFWVIQFVSPVDPRGALNGKEKGNQ